MNNEVMIELDDAKEKIRELEARAERAEKACAEMLTSISRSGFVRREELDAAKAEAERLRQVAVEAISHLAIIRDWDDHCEEQWEDPGACAGRGILKIKQALGKEGE